MSRNRVIHFFGDVNLIGGHKRLGEIAKAGKVDVEALKPGEFCAFINKRFSAIKLYGASGVILYWKADEGEKLHTGIVGVLPHFLSGADINYASAIAQAIGKHYADKIKRKGKMAA